jgi:hypothetical protein
MVQDVTTTPPSQGRRIWPLALTGAGAGLAALAVVGYVFAAPYLFSSGFHAAQYFPRDTWAYGAMTVRPGFSQLWAGKTLAEAFTSQSGFDSAVRALETSAPTGSNVDYEKELLPLLDGEIAVGTFGSTTQPDGVAMLHSSDPDNLLRVLAASDKSPEPRERYHGALYYLTATNGMAAASKGWVVSGSSRSIVEQALDRLEAGSSDSLLQSNRFQSVVNRLPGDRVGFLYFDTRPIMTSPAIQQSLAQGGQGLQDYLAPLTARVAVSLAAANDGLDAHWESIPDAPLRASTTFPRGSSISALDRMPSDTLFAVSGDSLPSLLSGLTDALNASLGSSAPKIQLQLNRWMGGEFAAGLTKGTLHQDQRNLTQGSPDMFLLARVKDSTAANADLAGLDKFLFPKATTIQGMAIKQLGTAPDNSAYYGVDNDWMYILWGEPERVLGRRTATNTTGSLAANPAFGEVRRAITPEGIAMFADLENGRRAVEDLLAPAQRTTYDKSRVLLQPIRALGGSLRIDDTGEMHGEFLLAISK